MFEHDNYRDIFNLRANSYHAAMQTCPRARDDEFHAILSLAEIEPQHSTLDLLSGGGYLSWYMAPDAELYHLETSAVFAKFGLPGTPHPVLLVNDGKLPFADNSIDRFLSLAGLHHIDDKTPIYREIARVLKPGGIAVIADAHADSNVAKFLDECVHKFNPMGHSGMYLSARTLEEIAETGLRISYSKTLDYFWRYTSTTEMAEYCRQMFGMTQGSENEITQGIAHYLGYQIEGESVAMHWNLHFIKMLKTFTFCP